MIVKDVIIEIIRMTAKQSFSAVIQERSQPEVEGQWCWLSTCCEHVTKTETLPSGFASAVCWKEELVYFQFWARSGLIAVRTACSIKMACLFHQLVCLLVVVINLDRSECVDTRVNKSLLRQRPKPSSRSNTSCFRFCRSMINDQGKLRVSTKMSTVCEY